MLDPEISIGNYKTLRFDKNLQGGGVVCYARNDLSYHAPSDFPNEIENILP